MQTRKEPAKPNTKQTATSSRSIDIRREFSAPVDQLFRACSESQMLKAWWWPKNIYADRVDLDFRVGGHYFINMKGFKDGSGGMTGTFKEIVENKRIVMSDRFANDRGEAISAQEAGQAGNWLEEVTITLEFSNLGETRGGLHLRQDGIPAEQHDNCTHGWQEMFDKLENFLVKKN